MDIRILPSNIANLIAAGEVVQRPASVVKELVENSVDAGATQITCIIGDSGRTLIQVIDNGCGMTPDEAVLCFERHATSKIATADDLGNIMTFGFRGEALPSIASVAEVTLKTRTEGQPVGCQVDFADSKQQAVIETACPVGANFAVRNLFYNVPARRKFLKSDNVEFKHIIEEFTRVALTRPDIGFSLIHNGRDIFVLRPAISLKYRIQDLLGSNVAGELVDVKADTTVVKVSGFTGRPDLAKKTLGNQFFFVNGRYFRSPYLHKAVMKAYENLIPEGATPSYFLFLEVDPHNVDVNIHPSKAEVKFEDDSVIFQIMFAAIKEALGTNSFGATIDFDTQGAPELPVIGSSFEKYHPVVAPSVDFDPTFNPFDTPSTGTQERKTSYGDFFDGGKQGDFRGYSAYTSQQQDYGRLFEEKTLPSTSVMILQGRYILVQAKSGLMAVSITRARERILYEKFLKVLTANGHVSQATLFPVQVTVGADNRLIFDEHNELLQSLGFDITPFGNDTIVVNGVPEGFSCDQKKVEAAMADILLILTDDRNSLQGVIESAMAERFARIGASGSDPVTSPQEAQRLIDTLSACEDPSFTSSGKKITTIISTDEIEKRFQ